MALVLAIEPDLRQAAILKRIIREKVKADVVIVDTRDAALDAIRSAVPDVMLLSALLSPRDEDELVADLRTLDGADHLQPHTIPQLASSLSEKGSSNPARGLLKAFRRKKDAEPSVAGCDPDLFAEEILTFLQQAAQRKKERQEARQYLGEREPKPAVVKAAAVAAEPAGIPSNAPSWDSPFEWRRAEPPARLDNPSSLIANPRIPDPHPESLVPNPESRIDPESRIADPESLISDRESLIADRESLIADRESLITDRESLIEDRESRVADRESRISDRESRIDAAGEGRGEETGEARVAAPIIDIAPVQFEVTETRIGEAGDHIAKLVEARMKEAAPVPQAVEEPAPAPIPEVAQAAGPEPVPLVTVAPVEELEPAPLTVAAHAEEREATPAPEPFAPVDVRPSIELDAVGTIELLDTEPASESPIRHASSDDRTDAFDDTEDAEVELSLDTPEDATRSADAFAAASDTESLEDAPAILEDGFAVARLGPLATWARTEWASDAAREREARSEALDLISRLAIPGHVAGVGYARGVRIRRVRVAGTRDRRATGGKTSGPVILSRKALEQHRAARP